MKRIRMMVARGNDDEEEGTGKADQEENFEVKEWKEEEDEYGYKEDIEQVDLEGREKKKASE